MRDSLACEPDAHIGRTPPRLPQDRKEVQSQERGPVTGKPHIQRATVVRALGALHAACRMCKCRERLLVRAPAGTCHEQMAWHAAALAA